MDTQVTGAPIPPDDHANKSTPASASPADATNKMLISVVLDRSGSMEGTRDNTISGYNEYLNGLRTDAASEYSVTLIQFDSAGFAGTPELTISCEDTPLAEVPALTRETYAPRGATPLYDAIGECIRRADVAVTRAPRAVTLVIITDGCENASKEFNQETIQALIKDRETSAHWTVVFLGAGIDSFAAAAAIGVNAATTANYAVGNEQAMYKTMARATMERSAGNTLYGVSAVASTPLFTAEQRCAMDPGNGQTATLPGGHTTTTIPSMGGRPAAPVTFPAAAGAAPPRRRFRTPTGSRAQTKWRVSH